MKRYDHDAVADYAIRLHHAASSLRHNFVAAMREQFPGISDAALRRAIDDAKMTVALGQLLHGEGRRHS